MGQGGLTLEVSLRETVTEHLKGVSRSFEKMRQTIVSLRADMVALNKDADQSNLSFESLFKGTGGLLGTMGQNAVAGLEETFRRGGQAAADYHAARRKDASETARLEEENAKKGDEGPLLEERLYRRKEYFQAVLQMMTEHGESRQALLMEGSRKESEIRRAAAADEDSLRKDQAEKEKKADAERLNDTKAFVGDMATAMKDLYSSGLAQSRSAYRMYQALAVAEATISTYKAAQEAYAKGVQMGSVVLGAVWAAASIATGMARVATIQSTKPKGFAFGGLIAGADRGERADNVLIRATPGEYMLDRSAVRHYGVPVLEALRRRSVPREVLEPFAAPKLPASGGLRAAYAFGGEIGGASLSGGEEAGNREDMTIINVMDFQREFDRALASARGRRVLINVLGEEGFSA